MFDLRDRVFPKGAFAALLGVLLLTLALAACGSSGSSDTSESTSGGEESTAAESEPTGGKDLAAWQAEAAKLQDPSSVAWPEPTEPYAPGSGRLAIVSIGESDTGAHTLTAATEEAATAAGWKTTVFDAEFDTNKAGGFVQQAVQEGYDGIVLTAVSPTVIQAPLASAIEAGIPIACSACVSPEDPQYEAVMDASAGGTSGRAEAVGVIAASEGKANAVYFYTPSQDVEAARTEQFEETFEECEECSLSIQEVPLGDLAKPGPPFFNGFVSSPLAQEVDWVTSSADAYTYPSMKTAMDRGLTQFKFAGIGALKEMTIPMSKGEPLPQVTVAEAYRYMGWAAADNVMRTKAGAETWDSSELPVELVTQKNAKHFAEGGEFEPPGGVPATFEKLWKG